jgi:hypothetical protein
MLSAMRRELIAQRLTLCLQEALEAPELRLIAVVGERPASDERREPWIPIKYGPGGPDDWFGVVPTTVRFERSPDGPLESLELVTKINPIQGLPRTLIPWVIQRREIALDRPFWEYRSAAESDEVSHREQQVYLLAERTPELSRVMPRCYGAATDAVRGEHALFLEFIADAARLDATGALADWPPDAIDAALTAAAGWQAVFWNVQPEQIPWAGRRFTTEDMIADVPLWRGLLDDARKRFPKIITDSIWRRRGDLIDHLEDWHPIKDGLPTTLTHDDFNQRNIGFRPAPVVVDWELAQLNTAHRDIVELLTFVLPLSADRSQVDGHLERHRAKLAALGVSTGVDPDAWIEGFRCELKVEAINRVAMQLLFGAEFQLPFLTRINRTIERLLDMYE